MKTAACFAITLLLLVASPVLTSEKAQPNVDNPSNSLVFGYIDMSDAPTKVDGAWLQQVSAPTDASYWSMGVENGLFYNPFIQPGTYQLSKFSGTGVMAGPHEYQFPRQGRNETAVTIDRPGLYFLGSFKYVTAQKGGMFKQGKFSIQPTAEPTEAELLRRMLQDERKVAKSKEYNGPKKIKMSETSWADRIRARLDELE